MAKKDDYLEGYAQGLKRGDENPVTGPINKALDEALGNPHESAKRGLDQGYKEMKKAKKLETVKMASGGSVSSASKRADGIAVKGKTKGRIC